MTEESTVATQEENLETTRRRAILAGDLRYIASFLQGKIREELSYEKAISTKSAEQSQMAAFLEEGANEFLNHLCKKI